VLVVGGGDDPITLIPEQRLIADSLPAGLRQVRVPARLRTRDRARRPGRLLGELAGATGIGRRPRRFVQSGERARVARPRRSAGRPPASPKSTVVGEHLATVVQTGTFCSYRP